jgi:hypothetical protein
MISSQGFNVAGSIVDPAQLVAPVVAVHWQHLAPECPIAQDNAH